jgi:C-terminal processing protease CtpA/Prc
MLLSKPFKLARIAVLGACILLVQAPCSAQSTKAEDDVSTPEEIFDELWGEFHDRYAFFELRGVDWDKQRETYKARVNSKTTSDELFSILSEMLAPLGDAHVNLIMKGDKKRAFCAEKTARFECEFPNNELLRQFWSLVDGTLEARGFGESVKVAKVFHYRRNDSYGYLRITDLEGPKKKALDKGLDQILDAVQDTQGLIIDIRANPGGTDDFVYRIMRRFADKKRVGHHKKTKKGPGEDEFGKLRTRHFEPGGDVRYKGRIVLLQNDASYSAADVFAMLMGDLPNVVSIGEHTNGVFSDMLVRKLPNGWKYTLSHQRYYSASEVCYEGKGIPVDHEVLNVRRDLETGVDPVISKALTLLTEEEFSPR